MSSETIPKPARNMMETDGWEDKQKTCGAISTSPLAPTPTDVSKKWKPSARSSRTKNCEAAMNGVAMTTSSEVEKFAHTSSGIRQNDMPGARMVMMVTRKFSAVAIDEAPANCTAIEKKSCPSGIEVESGA